MSLDKWFWKKLRINYNDSYKSIISIFIIASIVLTGVAASQYDWIIARLRCPNNWAGIFAQINATLVGISVAISVFYRGKRKLSHAHLKILSFATDLIFIFGAALCVLDSFLMTIRIESSLIICIIACGQIYFFFVFFILYWVIMQTNWEEIVTKNEEKWEDHIQDVKRLKRYFRIFSEILDTKYDETYSFYSQIDMLNGLNILKRNDVKFLKKLNDRVDETKIGNDITNIQEEIGHFKAIISMLGNEFTSLVETIEQESTLNQ